jgi:hypothetical protein
MSRRVVHDPVRQLSPPTPNERCYEQALALTGRPAAPTSRSFKDATAREETAFGAPAPRSDRRKWSLPAPAVTIEMGDETDRG